MNFNAPLHITLKLRDGLPSLRSSERMAEFLYAVGRAREFGLHILQFSIESNHIHLFAEAADNDSLSRGMKSLCGRFGKIIRGLAGGGGRVFAGRFHLHVLKTPTEVRRALEYILLNHAWHSKLVEHIDSFSSGFHFREWRELLGDRFRGLIEEQVERFQQAFEELCFPKSWLARAGWKLGRP